MKTMMMPLLWMTGCDLIAPSKAEPPPESLSACQTADGEGFDYGGFVEDTGSPIASIDGDTLSVAVGYGGGCEEHTWVLCWPDQEFLEEEPVQAQLEIWHGIDSDTRCDAYLSETLTFDLSPLRQQYQDGYGTDTGTISVQIGGESIEYTFDRGS